MSAANDTVTIVRTFSVGDVAVIVSIAASVLYHYFAGIRRVDRLADRHERLAEQVDDLRHGRGLVLGPTSDWPQRVRNCFGYGANGNGGA